MTNDQGRNNSSHPPVKTPSLIDSLKKLNALFPRRDKYIFGLLFVMMLIGAVLEILGVGAIPLFVAALATPDKVLAHPLGQRFLEPLGWTTPAQLIVAGSLILIAVFLIKNVYLVLNAYVQLRVVKNRQVTLGRRLFRAYMQAPYEFHLQRNSAELLRNVNVEAQMICNSVLMPLLELLMSAILTVGIFALLLSVEPLISLLALGVLGIAGGGFLWKINERIRAYGIEVQRHRSGLVKAVNQGLGSLKEARISRREGYFVDFLEYCMKRTALAQRYTMLASKSITHFLEVTAVTILLLLAVFLVLSGRSVASIIPTLALFGAALVRLKATVGKLVSGYNALTYRLVSVNPVYDDLKLLKTSISQNVTKAVKAMEFIDRIEIRNLSYRYLGTETNALQDINLVIPRGSSVGFIGPTGSGKTTLVDLILGLLTPTDGAVLVDDKNINGNLPGWQANIGYVPQFIYLTDDSIRRNIALGIDDKHIDESRIQEAIRAAQLQEFTDTLPNGLDTEVGERGVRLSGGQRQRIGIARALYRDPEVLVLDEGTSALDNETEQAVVAAIDTLKGDRTIIMIAHRLSTISNCDQIISISAGEIVNPEFPGKIGKVVSLT